MTKHDGYTYKDEFIFCSKKLQISITAICMLRQQHLSTVIRSTRVIRVSIIVVNPFAYSKDLSTQLIQIGTRQQEESFEPILS